MLVKQRIAIQKKAKPSDGLLAWGSLAGICSLPLVLALSEASQNHWLTKIIPAGNEIESYTQAGMIG